MNSFTVVVFAVMAAVVIAHRGGHGGRHGGGRRGHGPMPVSCQQPEPDTTAMDEHLTCVENVGKANGVDMEAARACVADCVKPVREGAITEEQKECLKERMTEQMTECANTIGVQLQEPKERGEGHKMKGGLFSIRYLLRQAEQCGVTDCVQAALGDAMTDRTKTREVMQAAKEQCPRPERPARVEPTAECQADLETIKQAMEEDTCGMRDAMSANAEECGIEMPVFGQRGSQQGGRQGGRRGGRHGGRHGGGRPGNSNQEENTVGEEELEGAQLKRGNFNKRA